jgi:hypothetical protein
MSQFTRREVLTAAAVTAGAAALPSVTAQAAAKYRRYNVTSAEGQKMLASYAKGVEAMLKLPADHPHNWFRNAFVHLMDCPHGNWWFYVWHRGYLGYFEQTIRKLSGDDTFAIPYWDWTELPEIPSSLFDGALTPTDNAFAPYTRNLAVFTSFIKPALTKYWDSLSSAQLAQLNVRGYPAIDNLWNDVTGFNPTVFPPDGAGISGNMAYAHRRAVADQLLQRRELSELYQLENTIAQHAADRSDQVLRARGLSAQQGAQLYRRRRAGRSGALRQHDQFPVARGPNLLHAPFEHGPAVGRMDAQTKGTQFSIPAAPARSENPVRRVVPVLRRRQWKLCH